MDFNDLALRLNRLYHAIGRAADWDVRKHVRVTPMDNTPDSLTLYQVTFDATTDETGNTNIIVSIIGHLAKLKDHLKNRMADSAQLVEDYINQSAYLQIIIDLSNSEKHGYPLQRRERSGKSPMLENIQCSLVIPPQERIGIEMNTGRIVDPGKSRIEVTADVVDGSGELIFRFAELIDNALSQWEQFIDTHDLI